jgi:hypothetical protein
MSDWIAFPCNLTMGQRIAVAGIFFSGYLALLGVHLIAAMKRRR